MDGKTKAGIISVVLAIIGLGAGGAVYNLDFSSDSSQSNTDNSVTSGDVINNYITEKVTEQVLNNEQLYDIGSEIALDIICENDSVPDGFLDQCIDYWCEYEPDYNSCVAEEEEYWYGP